jgi:methylmalonyl-CoA mutase cobalamin-binding domain/chain
METGVRGPGLQILIWPFQTGERIDLREEVINIPRQTNITRDNAPIDIDFLVYLRPIEAEAQKVVLEVVNYHQAVIGMATTILRAVIGEMNVDDVLSQRERINQELRIKLDDTTGRWGIKVSAVEIKEIEPAPQIQEAMNRQMSAERIRRADVTEAEGKRQASITIAEGDKQAEILRAEGNRQAEILTAEGDQQAAVLRAEGFSTALDRIHQIASEETQTQEDVDVIALSSLNNAHMTIFPNVLSLMQEKGLDDVLLVGGGIIPKKDMEELENLGTGKLFGPGTPIEETLNYIVNWVNENRR